MDMNMKEYVNWKMSHDVKYGESEGYPLVLEQCRKNKDLKNFQIYGNSVQDKGENLFNEETATANIYLDDTGVEHESTATGLRLSDYIEVKPFMNYSLILTNATTSATNARISFYDTEQVFVSQTVHSISAGTSSTKNIRIPENIYYVRISFASSVEFYEELNPENPLEIQSVGELTTKNLFDVSAFINSSKTTNGVTIERIGDKIHIYGIPTTSSMINVQFSGNFSLVLNKGDCIIGSCAGEDYSTMVNRFYAQFGLYYDGNFIVNANTTGKITLSEQINSLSYVSFHITPKDTETYIDFMFSLQLEENSVATEYEPYHKYKVPVTVRGKNLFEYIKADRVNAATVEALEKGAIVKGNLPSTGGDYSYSRGWFRPGYTNASALCPVLLKGDVVTVSMDVTLMELRYGSDYTPMMLLYSRTANTGYAVNPWITIPLNKTKRLKATFSIDATWSGHIFYPIIPLNSNVVKIENIQIAYGDDSDYEPYIEPQTHNIYLDEPLRKIGDYADYVDFEKQKAVRLNTEAEILTVGNDYNGKLSLCPHGYYDGKNQLLRKGKDRWAPILCSYTGSLGWSNDARSLISFYYSTFGVTNRTELQAKFDEIAESGNPLKVVYTHETPIEEPIDLPELPKSQSKTMIYEVIDTTIEPSNMYGKYVKKY